jgi:hypothetical protein
LPQLCRSTAQIPSPPSCPPSPINQKEEDNLPQNNKNRLKQQSGSSTDTQHSRAELKRQGLKFLNTLNFVFFSSGAAADSHKLPSRNSSSHSTDTSTSSQITELTPFKVRGGALRRPAGMHFCKFLFIFLIKGYQPELVCQIPWINGNNPERVIALTFNSAYGLAAVSTCVGLALIDLHTASLVFLKSL